MIVVVVLALPFCPDTECLRDYSVWYGLGVGHAFCEPVVLQQILLYGSHMEFVEAIVMAM